MLSRKFGVPENLAFATKPELDISQVKRLMAAGRALWAAVDEVYGRCAEFRTGKDALGWDQSEARTFVICRHTILTTLAQLRVVAVRAEIVDSNALPAARLGFHLR